jgi:hypothetical protein
LNKESTMITRQELKRIARARLRDAKVLYQHKRFDGAIYICGYAVELALKARICQTLNWTRGFPETSNEFKNLTNFKTHDLDTLLTLSGLETLIKTGYFADWSIVATWNPEARYAAIGTASRIDAQSMIKSSEVLLRHL